MWGWGWSAWLGMAVMMLLFWVLLVGAVVLVARWVRGDQPRGRAPGSGHADGSAESVLAERYARGEIDEEEYLRRRSVLRGS